MFHSFMKARRNENRIFSIREYAGQTINNIDGIARAFVEFYTALLGTKKENREHVCSSLVRAGPTVNEEYRVMLEADFKNADIKQALWSINGEKAPGPDGYGSNIFKDCWSTVGKDVTEGVLEFFASGKILKALNSTIITVIPKNKHVDTVGDYRPTACCNTVYKVISKVLCNMLKLILPWIISENQSAFVVGRTIVQNILICRT